MLENGPLARTGQFLQGRKTFHPALEIGDHGFHLRLLEHYFGHPDRIGIAGPPPGHIALLGVEPPQEEFLYAPFNSG